MHRGQYSRGKCVMMKLLLDETACESLLCARAGTQEGGVAVVNNKASFTVEPEQGALQRDIDTLTRLAISEKPRTRDSNLQPSFLLQGRRPQERLYFANSRIRASINLSFRDSCYPRSRVARKEKGRKNNRARTTGIFLSRVQISSVDRMRVPVIPLLLAFSPTVNAKRNRSCTAGQSLRKVREIAFTAIIRTAINGGFDLSVGPSIFRAVHLARTLLTATRIISIDASAAIKPGTVYKMQ